MKTRSIIMVMVMALPFFVFAQEEKPTEENKKLELKPYGFVKGDMIYTTGGVYSWGSEANCYISSPQFASGLDTSAVGITGQHTRFGLKGTVGETIKAGGLIELDFYVGPHDANARPRIRLAYASIAKGGFEARFGQQWDIFSPLNANTNNTNGNMWFAGNRGFRRGQIQLIYSIKNEKVAPMVQFSLGETTRDVAGLGKDNLSGIPMIQGRLSAKLVDKYTVGFSIVNASYVEKKGTMQDTLALLKDISLNTSGIGVDINLPIHKYFSLNGEFNTGTNLNNANLFSVAGNYIWRLDTLSNVTITDKKSMGMWFNAQSKVTDWLQIVVGYGMDKNVSDKYAIGNVESNAVFYGNLIFPIKHGFSVRLELMNIETTMVTDIDADNKITGTKVNTANVINLAGVITF